MIRRLVMVCMLIAICFGLYFFLFRYRYEDQLFVQQTLQEEKIAYQGLQVQPLVVDDTQIEFPWTDDNTGESLIIKSDKKIYAGQTENEVYVSVTNTSLVDQNAALIFYFPEKKEAQLVTIASFNNNSWSFLNFFKKNIKVNQTLLGVAMEKRGSIPGSLAPKAATQVYVPAGETIYLKSKIIYSAGDTGEFWIEGLGDRGGYGLLDPVYASIVIRGGVRFRGGVAVNKVPVATAGGCGGACAVKVDDAGNNTFTTANSQVMRTSTGDLYLVLVQGAGGATAPIEMWFSGDDGQTWAEKDSADRPPGVDSVYHYVTMTIDSNDDLHVAYMGQISSFTDAVYVLFDTGTQQWGTPESAAEGTLDGETDNVAIAVDSNNIPHIISNFFDEVNGRSLNYTNRIGGTWKIGVVIEALGSSNFTPLDIAISEDNIPEIAYTDTVATSIIASVGNANDATSFTKKSIDTSVIASNASIAIDSGGNTWVAYRDDTATDVITLVKHNDADAWATWQSSVTNDIVGSEPSLAINGTDVHIYFIDSGSDIAFDMYNGTTWTGKTVLDVGTLDAPSVRWVSVSNASYTTYGFDYMYTDGIDTWYNNW